MREEPGCSQVPDLRLRGNPGHERPILRVFHLTGREPHLFRLQDGQKFAQTPDVVRMEMGNGHPADPPALFLQQRKHRSIGPTRPAGLKETTTVQQEGCSVRKPYQLGVPLPDIQYRQGESPG